MAARLGEDGNRQALANFITTSPWDPARIRAQLAWRMEEAIGPDAFVFDDTGFLKDESASACVSRQYTGTAGKVTNCQVGVSLHLASDHASTVDNWRLFLPPSWDPASPKADADTVARRAACGIPDDVGYVEKWQLALDMLDETRSWELEVPLAVADAGYGDAAAFRHGLQERGVNYVVGISATPSAQSADAVPVTEPYSRSGRPPAAKYPDKPQSVKELVLAAGQKAARPVQWRQGSRPGSGRSGRERMYSRFVALRIRPAGREVRQHVDGPEHPVCWLLAEWPAGGSEPVQLWLSDLSSGMPLTTLVRLAKLRRRIEHDYRELKHGLGLDHLGGRSWPGWHHHVTLKLTESAQARWRAVSLNACSQAGVRRSMSAIGSLADNALAESSPSARRSHARRFGAESTGPANARPVSTRCAGCTAATPDAVVPARTTESHRLRDSTHNFNCPGPRGQPVSRIPGPYRHTQCAITSTGVLMPLVRRRHVPRTVPSTMINPKIVPATQPPGHPATRPT